MTELNPDGTYSVTFYPIDGSQVIDPNFAVASVYAVWDSTNLDGLTGRNLKGAALAVYGSRTTIILYNTQN